MKIGEIQNGVGAMLQGAGGERIFNLDTKQVIEQFKSTGAVMFRGFDLNLKDFGNFAGLFGTDYMTYRGGSYVRKAVDSEDKTLLSVNHDYGREKQDTFGLPLHGEMYYRDERPMVLWFYCVRPASTDGETTICDGSQIYNELSGPTKELFHRNRLRYIRRYHDGEWQVIFQTDDIDEAAQFAKEIGLTVDVDRINKRMRTEYVYPAIITSTWGNHTVYINNMLPVLWQESMGRETSIVRFEDGSKIPEDIALEVSEIEKRLTVPLPWQKQDFVMLDNTRFMHGRRRFTDVHREIYLKMLRSVNF
jgi:alpha-ketoglutarate-dependent taurine dioxygenase